MQLHKQLNRGCPRRNVPDFGRKFLMLKYTDIIQNTYIQSWTVTEIMARERCGLLAVPRTVPVQLTRYLYTVHVRPWSGMSQHCYFVTNGCTKLQKCLLCFPTWNIVTCVLCMDFAMAMHVLLLKNKKGVFPIKGFRLEVYLLVFTRHCVRLVVYQVLLCSLKGRWYERLTHERTFLRWFREVHVCPLVELPLALAYHICKCGELYMKIYILIMIKGYNIWNRATMLNVWICATG